MDIYDFLDDQLMVPRRTGKNRKSAHCRTVGERQIDFKAD